MTQGLAHDVSQSMLYVRVEVGALVSAADPLEL